MRMYTYGDRASGKVSQQLLLRSKNRLKQHLLFVSLTTMVGMTAYEGLKQFVLPKITVWQSHTITIENVRAAWRRSLAPTMGQEQ